MAGRRGREGAFTTSGLDFFFFFSLLLSRCLPLHFFPSSVDVPPLCICKAPHVVRFPDCSSAYPPFPRHIFLAMGARDLGTLRTNDKVVDPRVMIRRRQSLRMPSFSVFFSNPLCGLVTPSLEYNCIFDPINPLNLKPVYSYLNTVYP